MNLARVLILLITLSTVVARVDSQEAQPEGQASQDPGTDSVHREPTRPLDLSHFTREELARIDRLFGRIVCKCPNENWTKTLNGCPDGCADEQKSQVRLAVKQNWSDDRILEDQVKRYGPKVLAAPLPGGFTGFLLYAGPFVGLFALAVIVIALVMRWTKPRPSEDSTSKPAPSQAANEQSEEDRQWSERIDRELEEMD